MSFIFIRFMVHINTKACGFLHSHVKQENIYYKKYFTTQSNSIFCSHSCEQFTMDHTVESISCGSSKLSHFGQIELLKHFGVGFCLSTFSKKNVFQV